MHRFLIAIFAFAFGANCYADTTLSDGTVLPDAPAWIVTYIEVAADSADEAVALIKKQTAASKEEEGNLRFEGLQRIGRANHFAILEAWSDPAARAAHAAAAHTRSFREALQPMLYSPYDERPHLGLVATDPEVIPDGNDSTVYVLTHADIVPPEQFAPCNRSPDPEGPCGNEMLINHTNASRAHAGNLRFDVLTQSNRANHMTVVEMWDSIESQAAHQVHVDTKYVRDQLAGIVAGSGVNSDPQFILNMMIGSLWDERLYRLISR